jgi:hypothetical protein
LSLTHTGSARGARRRPAGRSARTGSGGCARARSRRSRQADELGRLGGGQELEVLGGRLGDTINGHLPLLTDTTWPAASGGNGLAPWDSTTVRSTTCLVTTRRGPGRLRTSPTSCCRRASDSSGFDVRPPRCRTGVRRPRSRRCEPRADRDGRGRAAASRPGQQRAGQTRRSSAVIGVVEAERNGEQKCRISGWYRQVLASCAFALSAHLAVVAGSPHCAISVWTRHIPLDQRDRSTPPLNHGSRFLQQRGVPRPRRVRWRQRR